MKLLKLSTFAALACALVAASMLLVSPAFGARGMEIAVQQDEVFVHQVPNRSLGRMPPRERGFQLATRLHAGWIRANVVWNVVLGSDSRLQRAPQTIRYDWSAYDALVDGAAKRGLRVQLALSGPAPAWATANHKPGTYKPSTAAYLQFVQAAVEHFRGRVSRYSVWNEPNYNDWLTPLSAAASIYGSLYRSSYPLIKRLDPTAKVLFGETAANASKKGIAPLRFIRDVVCAKPNYRPTRRCAPILTDGVAMHPYDLWHPVTYQFPGQDNVTLGTIGRLTSALDKLKRANLLKTPAGGTPYVYVTEYGYLSATKHRVDPRTQGKRLVQAFNLAARNPRIKQMLQYVLIKTSGRYTYFDTSIAGRGGNPTAAFNALASWVRSAIRTGRAAAPGKPPR